VIKPPHEPQIPHFVRDDNVFGLPRLPKVPQIYFKFEPYCMRHRNKTRILPVAAATRIAAARLFHFIHEAGAWQAPSFKLRFDPTRPISKRIIGA
jgi:hypothetical protein